MIINQPKTLTIAEKICDYLEIQKGKPKFDNLYIMVAYVRKSGVEIIKDSLAKFRRHGGKVKAIIGIDDNNTSEEGVQLLLDNADEVYIYHSTNPFQTFHPKLYVFEKKLVKAVIFVGSNNLTQGGLISNYEVSAEIELDLKNAKHNEQFAEIKEVFSQYSNLMSPCCKLLDTDLLKKLKQRNLVESEQNRKMRTWFKHKKEISRKPLFGKEAIPKRKKAVSKRLSQTYKPTKQGFWKKLSSFDVSKSSAPGQMIIPISYLGMFPSMNNWTETAVGARQRDVYFDVSFIDSKGKKQKIKNVRAILYVPSPYHPRPNQELRFTFRNKSIQNQLKKGDVLEFRRTTSYSIWFEIQHFPKKSKQAQIYLSGKKRYDKI